jgi:hypothetical protein
MKIVKQTNSYEVKLSFQEWKNIGIKTGWFRQAQMTDVALPPDPSTVTPPVLPKPAAVPQPLPQKPKKPKPIAQEVIPYEGGDLEGEVEMHVDAVIENYTRQENSGIGNYEFHGQVGNDIGEDYAAFDGFSLAVNVTGSVYDEFAHPDNSQELPFPSGRSSAGDSTISWKAHGKLQQLGGKTYAMFYVEETNGF